MKRIALVFLLVLLGTRAFAGPTRHSLSNGMQVVLSESPSSTLAGVSILVWGGILCEKREERGTFSILSDMLLRGTLSRTQQEIAKEVSLFGDSVSSYTGTEYWAIDATVPAASLGEYLFFCYDLLFNPQLSEKELEKVKKTKIQSLRASDDVPENRLAELYRSVFYPDIHLSNEERIANITKADRAFLDRIHKSYFVPERIVISIAGDIETGAIFALIEDLFDDAPQKTGPYPDERLVQRDGSLPVYRVEGGGVTQASILTGTRLRGFDRSDEHTVMLLGAVLDNSLGGRLFNGLREEKGLVYDVRTGYSLSIRPYTWYVISTSRRKNTSTVREETEKILNDLKRKPPTPEEIKLAKQYLKTMLAIRSLTPLFEARYNAERLLRGERILSFEERTMILDGLTDEDLSSFVSAYFPSRWTTLVVR